MPNKMIIDASHPEETRVVVLRGSRVEEFDFESASKRPLRGNIYLAKVTRVEPSLQAAFVDYGGNRHGFLAFSEVHPDYYQIPVADRQALLEEEARSQREDDEEPNNERRSRRHRRPRQSELEARATGGEAVSESAAVGDDATNAAESAADPTHSAGVLEDAALLPTRNGAGNAAGCVERFVGDCLFRRRICGAFRRRACSDGRGRATFRSRRDRGRSRRGRERRKRERLRRRPAG